MGLFTYFKGLTNISNGVDDLETACFNTEQSLAYRKLALEITIDMVANSVARVDWKEFKQFKSKTTDTTYRLNVSPNVTETSTEFFKHYVKRLLLDGEVLIYPDPTTGQLFIAESFTVSQPSRTVRKFEAVMFEGDTKTASYKEDEVIYLKYNQENIKTFMYNYLSDYEKLVKSANGSYRSNKTRRFILESNMFTSSTSEHQKATNQMFTQQLAEWASSEETAKVYGKSNQWQVSDMSDKQIESAKDSRDLIQDIFAIVAQTYHVPVQMIVSQWSGATITQNVIDNYLVGIVYPIVDLFKEGFNKYNYTMAQYQNGEFIKADTTKVRLTDLKTIGTFIAQVFPTGALSLNEVIENYLQLDAVDPEIGDIRVITKNYAKLEDFKDGSTSALAFDEQIDADEKLKTMEDEKNDN